MLANTILVIPAEGDSVETERWYVHALKNHYGKGTKVLVFNYGTREENIALGAVERMNEFFNKLHPHVGNLEIHAQAGFGAYLAYMMLCEYPKRINRVFFVGGAPCDAMTPIAKWFHRHFVKMWYKSRIPFFADDPNPKHSRIIDKIKQSSTAAMRANPLLYRNQLLTIGHWHILPGWKPRKDCQVWFVPNGKAPFPSWWNNTYNNKKAAWFWLQHDVPSTRRPGGGFSLYSMMPANALFDVMDEVRDIDN